MRAEGLPRLGTRAVLVRAVDIDSAKPCVACGQIRWVREGEGGKAMGKTYVVVANVYRRGRWDRTETWHQDCYEKAGSPHGEAVFRKRMAGFSRPKVPAV